MHRFPSAKFRRHKVVTCIVRCKMHAAMLDDEKITDFEAVQVESSSLAWLHKAAPAFPVDGSKVFVAFFITIKYGQRLHLIYNCRSQLFMSHRNFIRLCWKNAKLLKKE